MTSNPNDGYFRKLLKGQLSLLTTFWIWFVLVFIFINLFIDFNFEEIDLYRTQTEQLFTIVFYFLTILYSIIIFIAVIKSANNYKGSKFFSFFAKLMVTIHLIFSLLSALDISRVYFFDDYALESEIESFRNNLPIPIDSYTNLVDISKEKKDINYVYQFLKIDLNKDKNKHNYNSFKQQVQDSICENENNLDLLKKDYILKYTYIDKHGAKMLDVLTKKESCGKSIYDLEILKKILEEENLYYDL